MKVILETYEYASCHRCGRPATPDNPIIRIGSPLTAEVWLHKGCFDAISTMVNDVFESWRKFYGDPGH